MFVCTQFLETEIVDLGEDFLVVGLLFKLSVCFYSVFYRGCKSGCGGHTFRLSYIIG